ATVSKDVPGAQRRHHELTLVPRTGKTDMIPQRIVIYPAAPPVSGPALPHFMLQRVRQNLMKRPQGEDDPRQKDHAYEKKSFADVLSSAEKAAQAVKPQQDDAVRARQNE